MNTFREEKPLGMIRKLGCGLFAFFLLILIVSPASTSGLADRQPIVEALQWVRAPLRDITRYDYIMTARLRLIFFWAGKDDVGGGYIRRGISSEDSHQEFFQVLFGSDPQKAPRAINRWGAGTEVAWHKDPVAFPPREDDVTSSVFFGFMKSSSGKSATEMQKELKKEQEQGQHAFTGILSRVEVSRALSTIVPLQSDTDFNLHQYDVAEPLMLDRIAHSDRPVRQLEDSGRCSRAASFLATVAELMNAALAGNSAPLSRCYVHDAQENTLTLERVTPVPDLHVQLHGPKNAVLLDTSYSNLLQLDYASTHKLTGKRVEFSLMVGRQGNLRGVPVQIRYQPNWWFQIVLNLRPDSLQNPNSNSVPALALR
jgi:hypothetical protein